MTDKGTFPIGRFILNFEADNPFGPEYQHDLATWKANSAGLAWNPNVPFQEFNTQLYDLCESWWMMMPKYYDKLQVHENCPLWLDYVKLHNELIRYLEAREFYTQDFTSPLMMDMLKWKELNREHFPQIPILANSVITTNQFFVGPRLCQAYQTRKAHKYRLQ